MRQLRIVLAFDIVSDMSILSRSSLASTICPSAPFLAPRFLCAPARRAALRPSCATPTAGLRRPTYATKAQQKKPTAKPLGGTKRLLQLDILTDHLPLLERFQKACATCNLRVIMDLYPTVVASPLIRREDIRRVAQALHTHFRTTPRHVTERGAQPFLEHLTADIRTGKLPPHPAAHVHLLGIYKEGRMYEQGNSFWQWLAAQDDSFVDQAVYGAAIELLAYRGTDSLDDLEELYADGLKRFPGTFAGYHLSPEAVVPDRSQATTVAGLPIALLQGITTARILNRDWKNAYLALDTALRLYPTTVPTRFFDLFMTERPLSEAYTVFLLACRSGVVLKPNNLTTLLNNLNKAAFRLNSHEERATILRGMANAVYAYVQAGGTVEGPHVGVLFNSFRLLLPTYQDGKTIAENEAKIRNSIVASAHEMMSLLIQAGLPPYPQLFVSLAQLAGSFKVPELLAVVQQDVDSTKVDLGDVGRRCMLHVAGELRDKRLIEDYWSRIVAQAESLGQLINAIDWTTLARVCRRADHREYFQLQLQALKHAIDWNTEQKALVELDEDDRTPRASPYTLLDPEEFAAEMEKIKRILKNVAAVVMAGQPLSLRNTPFTMFLDPTKESLASKEDLQIVYDELSTDPHQPQPALDSQLKTPVSSTEIPFAELRFLNWVTIVGLMREAEASETEFQRRLNHAIANGIPLEKRHPLMPNFHKPKNTTSDEATMSKSLSRIPLRNMVKRLRGPYASNVRPQTPLLTEKASSTMSGNGPRLHYHVAKTSEPNRPTRRNVNHNIS